MYGCGFYFGACVITSFCDCVDSIEMLTSVVFSLVTYFSQTLFCHPCMVSYFPLHVLHELSFFTKQNKKM